jgi:2-desacetyl-2-hydroxyethyl bacteriochlorophyllide A dehydrogenase
MRAFVVTSPRTARVEEVDEPVAGPGQVIVDVARVGVCGTDVEFFTGEMAYLQSGQAEYPLRLGHEWCGTVASVGEGVDAWWLGRRVTGDTMLGCGHCRRCLSGRQHVCADRHEIGIRYGWPGALAERLLVPSTALHALPDSIDDVTGALVEPGGNALRAVLAAGAGPGRRILVWGSGTIGLLTAQLAVAHGAVVDVIGHHDETLQMARDFGATQAVRGEHDLEGAYDAVIDATNDKAVPAQALDFVEPGGRVVYIGLSGEPSLVDTRTVALKDVTVVGILSASPGLTGVIEHYADGRVDPRPVVAATVGLAATADVLAGCRPGQAGPGPKIHIDPRRN